MSMRMNAFHDIVNSYSKPGMGINGNAPGVCKNDGPSDAALAIGALANIGMTVATMALQAKAETQNQQASNSNAAINNAMKDAQDALVQLPKNSADYAKLQGEIAEIDKQLKALDSLNENKKTQSFLKDGFSNAKVQDMSLAKAIETISAGTSSVGNLRTALASAEQLQQKQTLAEADAEKSYPTPSFSQYSTGFPGYAEEGGGAQAQTFIKKNEEKYYETDEKGVKTFLERTFASDMKKAQDADAEFSKINEAKKQAAAYAEQKEKTCADALNGLPDNLKSVLTNSGMNTIDALKSAISEIDKFVNDLKNENVTSNDGTQTMSVGEYMTKKDDVDKQVALASKAENNGGAKALEEQKAAKQSEIDSKAQPELQKLATAYDNLEAILSDIQRCKTENDQIQSAKDEYKLVKSKEKGENGKKLSGFQKFFGVGVTDQMRETRQSLKAEIAREKSEAKAEEQSFISKYGTPPSASFENQVITQMKSIQTAVKQAGLEDSAKRLKLDFGFDS